MKINLENKKPSRKKASEAAPVLELPKIKKERVSRPRKTKAEKITEPTIAPVSEQPESPIVKVPENLPIESSRFYENKNGNRHEKLFEQYGTNNEIELAQILDAEAAKENSGVTVETVPANPLDAQPRPEQPAPTAPIRRPEIIVHPEPKPIRRYPEPLNPLKPKPKGGFLEKIRSWFEDPDIEDEE